MPITWQMTPTRVDVVFTDPYSLAESESVMKQIFSRPDLQRPLRLLVDVRGSAPPTTEFVGNAITFWQMHVDKMWDAKIAVVTGTPDQTRMANVSDLTARSRELPFTLRAFEDGAVAEAREWLEV